MMKTRVIHVLFILAISILVYRCGSNLVTFIEPYLPKPVKTDAVTIMNDTNSLEAVVRALVYWVIGMSGMIICICLKPLGSLPVYALLIGFAKLTVFSGFRSVIYPEHVPVALLLCIVNLVFFTAFYARTCSLLQNATVPRHDHRSIVNGDAGSDSVDFTGFTTLNGADGDDTNSATADGLTS